MKEYVEERNGALYIAGKRVTLDSVVYGFRDGESPETIRQNFDTLTLEQVYGAITYYLANQSEVDAYLEEQEALFAEEARRNPIPPELAAKLDAARERLRQPR